MNKDLHHMQVLAWSGMLILLYDENQILRVVGKDAGRRKGREILGCTRVISLPTLPGCLFQNITSTAMFNTHTHTRCLIRQTNAMLYSYSIDVSVSLFAPSVKIRKDGISRLSLSLPDLPPPIIHPSQGREIAEPGRGRGCVAALMLSPIFRAT